MKKRIILALTVCLFAAGSIINMHLAQNDHNTDMSLADISVMAQADGEIGDCTNCKLSFCYSHSNYNECVTNGELTPCSKNTSCP
ncbi:MAG: hypothetical protein ACOCU3_01115 [bacterium]